MRQITLLAAAAVVALTTGTVAQAEPGGCIKYGAAGAVGGHLVKHGVLGAVGGCVTGMYRRHEYRKEAKQKAALYDQEHPGAKGTYQEKATAYDVEHSTQPGKMTSGTPAPAAGAPSATGPQDTHF
ncbi:MAG: hypothetical protein ACTINM_01825 [Acetobacter cibinongensis]